MPAVQEIALLSQAHIDAADALKQSDIAHRNAAGTVLETRRRLRVVSARRVGQSAAGGGIRMSPVGAAAGARGPQCIADRLIALLCAPRAAKPNGFDSPVTAC
jgi:hypothetical protein